MERYIQAMSNSGADAWEIIDTKTQSWQFYFIGHALDQNRATDVEHITLKAYKQSTDGQYMGEATAAVSPTETTANINQIARDLVDHASLVQNKNYTLNQPSATSPISHAETSLKQEAEAYLKAMQSVQETADEDINSYEVFVNLNKRRLITSTGIDHTDTYPTSMLDIVVNARKDDHEIELSRLYHAGTCQPLQLKEDIEELMRYGKDRLLASPTPSIDNCPVVFSTDAALQIYSYFLDNLNAAYKVRGISHFNIDEPVTHQAHGDLLTLKTMRYLDGSPSNFAYDIEGAPIEDATLIDHGVVKRFIGNRMFSQYLGLNQSFIVSNWCVEGGTATETSIRSGACLEVVEFSDFQVDSMTGDLFGEIRLAYYRDGKGGITPVTGGSISGSMLDNLDSMQMTQALRQYASALIPKATRLNKLTVAGES